MSRANRPSSAAASSFSSVPATEFVIDGDSTTAGVTAIENDGYKVISFRVRLAAVLRDLFARDGKDKVHVMKFCNWGVTCSAKRRTASKEDYNDRTQGVVICGVWNSLTRALSKTTFETEIHTGLTAEINKLVSLIKKFSTAPVYLVIPYMVEEPCPSRNEHYSSMHKISSPAYPDSEILKTVVMETSGVTTIKSVVKSGKPLIGSGPDSLHMSATGHRQVGEANYKAIKY